MCDSEKFESEMRREDGRPRGDSVNQKEWRRREGAMCRCYMRGGSGGGDSIESVSAAEQMTEMSRARRLSSADSPNYARHTKRP
ncbi:hypothetical protein J6590_032386 [Homalodisca vitripennis]|nr:hypothetical protein J6590_032386 [Homalodisca vitripennis]